MSTGMFTVRVLEAKIDVPGIAIHQTCIVARLLPYSKIGTTKVSTGSHPTWKAAVFQFPHTRGDSSLKLQLQVFQDPPLLARKLLGIWFTYYEIELCCRVIYDGFFRKYAKASLLRSNVA